MQPSMAAKIVNIYVQVYYKIIIVNNKEESDKCLGITSQIKIRPD